MSANIFSLSILIINYNKQKYLKYSLQSYLNQILINRKNKIIYIGNVLADNSK